MSRTNMVADKTDVENYVKMLNERRKSIDQNDSSPIPDLYKSVEDAYWQVYHDTLSEDFQIVIDLQEVFWKYAQRHILELGRQGLKDKVEE